MAATERLAVKGLGAWRWRVDREGCDPGLVEAEAVAAARVAELRGGMLPTSNARCMPLPERRLPLPLLLRRTRGGWFRALDPAAAAAAAAAGGDEPARDVEAASLLLLTLNDAAKRGTAVAKGLYRGGDGCGCGCGRLDRCNDEAASASGSDDDGVVAVAVLTLAAAAGAAESPLPPAGSNSGCWRCPPRGTAAVSTASGWTPAAATAE